MVRPLAKHKVAGSTPVIRSHELGLRRGGRLAEDEERRWGSEDPFPGEWRSYSGANSTLNAAFP